MFRWGESGQHLFQGQRPSLLHHFARVRHSQCQLWLSPSLRSPGNTPFLWLFVHKHFHQLPEAAEGFLLLVAGSTWGPRPSPMLPPLCTQFRATTTKPCHRRIPVFSGLSKIGLASLFGCFPLGTAPDGFSSFCGGRRAAFLSSASCFTFWSEGSVVLSGGCRGGWLTNLPSLGTGSLPLPIRWLSSLIPSAWDSWSLGSPPAPSPWLAPGWLSWGVWSPSVWRWSNPLMSGTSRRALSLCMRGCRWPEAERPLSR